ncbi:hypothetical protein GCM10027174_01320 [Salinifilum aidingensis]
MVRPERRTKGDIAAAVSLVLAVLVGAAVLWWHSDARATRSEPAAAPIPERTAAGTVPQQFAELWRAPSPATERPAVAGPAVVTGRGSEVTGRDPVTGRAAWRYARDLPLCTVGAEWDRALAVYRKEHNCSEVTSLRGPDGVRGPQRNTDAEFGTQLLSDGTYVTATGRNIVESWRSDLVRTQQFGVPVAVKNPDNNIPRPDCTYSSTAAGDERVALIEECPREATDRVTVLKTHPEDSEEPEEVVTTLAGSSSAEVVAVSEQRVAVLLADRGRLQVFSNSSGSLVGEYPVRVGADRPADGPVRTPETAHGQYLYWNTGEDTVALDPHRLTPVWTLPDALGPGAHFGGRLLVPVDGGLAVLSPGTGERVRTVPVDRGDHTGPVRVSTAGPVVLEQRGDTVVALGAPRARG